MNYNRHQSRRFPPNVGYEDENIENQYGKTSSINAEMKDYANNLFFIILIIVLLTILIIYFGKITHISMLIHFMFYNFINSLVKMH